MQIGKLCLQKRLILCYFTVRRIRKLYPLSRNSFRSSWAWWVVYFLYVVPDPICPKRKARTLWISFQKLSQLKKILERFTCVWMEELFTGLEKHTKKWIKLINRDGENTDFLNELGSWAAMSTREWNTIYLTFVSHIKEIVNIEKINQSLMML